MGPWLNTRHRIVTLGLLALLALAVVGLILTRESNDPVASPGSQRKPRRPRLDETEANAGMAEQEWQRTASRYRAQSVSAAPAINLRPTNSGVEVHVRYITSANERYAVRTRLYQAIVDCLAPEAGGAGAGGEPVGEELKARSITNPRLILQQT